MTLDKDYIYALTGAHPDMNCWSDTSIAFIGQLWFIGFLTKVPIVPLQERYGYQFCLKVFVIPLNILSFQLQYLPNSYILRCIGFFISGFCKIKQVPCMILLKDLVSKRYSSVATTFMYCFYFSSIMMFCLYIEFISKNAILYLDFVNGISILSSMVIYAIGFESPLRCIE